MEIIHAHEGSTVDRTGDAIFEGGQVWGRALATRANSDQVSLQIVQFAAGAKTRPHTHSRDQLLYVVSGIGKVGADGEERTVSAGDFVLIPAGEVHWHGAADTGSPMSHIAITPADSEFTIVD